MVEKKNETKGDNRSTKPTTKASYSDNRPAVAKFC